MDLRCHRTYSAWLIAAILSSSLAFGAPATVDSATKAQLKAATAHYERGVSALDAENFADALKAFKASYDTVSSPNSRLMIGRVLVKMGKLDEAYQELTFTITQASTLAANQKKYQKTVDSAQKELDELKNRLAFVQVKHGAKVQLQGVPVKLEGWQTLLPVVPGTVSVEVTFTNGRTYAKSLTLKAGDVREFMVDEAPQTTLGAATTSTSSQEQVVPTSATTEATLNRRNVGYVVGGVGFLGLGLFVGFGLIGASGAGDPKSDCNTGNCPENAVDDASSKALKQGIGYTGLGMGILGVGVGTWLILTGGKTATATALHLAPGSVQLSRRF